MEVNELYDSIADEYDSHDESTQLVAEDLFNYGIIKERADLTSILDLGCGTGRAIKFLNPEPENYTGIDISSKMLEVARRKYPKYTFIHGDLKCADSYSASCTISMFGSPCYTDISQIIPLLKRLKSIIYLGMYGVGRNRKTFEASSEFGKLQPWYATNSNLSLFYSSFERITIWKCDIYKDWKQKLSISNYKRLIEIESKLPFSVEKYAWVLMEIDNND